MQGVQGLPVGDLRAHVGGVPRVGAAHPALPAAAHAVADVPHRGRALVGPAPEALLHRSASVSVGASCLGSISMMSPPCLVPSVKLTNHLFGRAPQCVSG